MKYSPQRDEFDYGDQYSTRTRASTSPTTEGGERSYKYKDGEGRGHAARRQLLLEGQVQVHAPSRC